MWVPSPFLETGSSPGCGPICVCGKLPGPFLETYDRNCNVSHSGGARPEEEVLMPGRAAEGWWGKTPAQRTDDSD